MFFFEIWQGIWTAILKNVYGRLLLFFYIWPQMLNFIKGSFCVLKENEDYQYFFFLKKGEVYGDYVARVFLLVNIGIFTKTIFKTHICSLPHHQMNMRTLKKVQIYLITIMRLLEYAKYFFWMVITFLQKHLSVQLLVFIDDLLFLLGQHNRCF